MVCEVEGITLSTLYRKIGFVHRKCIAFAAERERNLPSMPLARLMINWSDADDRRNIVFRAVSSADNATGYVLGLDLNFDPSLDPDRIERDAIASGDYEVKPASGSGAITSTPSGKPRTPRCGAPLGSLKESIAATYQDADARDDIEVPDTLDDDLTLPRDGMQMRGEYTMYGHFFFLRRLLDTTEKIRFFLDQDSAFRAACLSAVSDRIKEG